MSGKCRAKKKDGEPCTNKAKTGGACGVSGHSEYVKNLSSLSLIQSKVVHVVEIPELHKLFEKNSVITSTTINKKLYDGPSPKDGPGHIYMYYIKGDAHADYRKVGMTKQLPTRRVSEGWPGGTIRGSWPCKRHKMAEHLIHLYLTYARVERWAVAVGSQNRRIYLSFWKDKIHTNRDTKERIPTEFVADRHFMEYGTRLYVQGEQNIFVMAKKLRVENPHTEWFKEKEDIILNCIRKVIGAVNTAYKDEEWSKDMMGLK